MAHRNQEFIDSLVWTFTNLNGHVCQLDLTSKLLICNETRKRISAIVASPLDQQRQRYLDNGTGYRWNQVSAQVKHEIANTLLEDLHYFILNTRGAEDILLKVLDAVAEEYVQSLSELHDVPRNVYRIRLAHSDDHNDPSLRELLHYEDKIIRVTEWVKRALELNSGRNEDYLARIGFEQADNLENASYLLHTPTIYIDGDISDDFGASVKINWEGPQGFEYGRKGIVNIGDEIPTEPNSSAVLEPESTFRLQRGKVCLAYYRESNLDPWSVVSLEIPVEQREQYEEETEEEQQ